MSQFNLSSYTILRPEKISWFFPHQTNDLLSEVKSKSLRGFLRKAPELLAEHGLIQNISQISKEEFVAWLPYYTEKMAEQSYEILATPEWFDLKMEQKKEVYSIFINQGERMVAALIFTYTPENNHSSIAFRANDRLDIFSGGRSSIGALLDYAFLKWSLEKKCTAISAGRTRNAFGVINTIGNLDYKLRFGYQPQPTINTDIETSVPLNEAGCVYFYGWQDQKLLLFALHPTGSEFDTNLSRYTTAQLGFKEITY
jgi:hypothetical protein